MHLFDHPELASLAVASLMGQVPIHVEPAARGGRNAVFKATLSDGSSWAVRLGAPGSGPEFSSGIGWQKLLVDHGVPAIVATHLDAEGRSCGSPCSIAPWTHARDAEKVVGSLTPAELTALGRAMAGWTQAMLPMIQVHPARGAGLLRFGSAECSHASWWDYLRDNTEWRLARALENSVWSAGQDQDLLRAFESVWHSLRPAIDGAPLSLFAWDIGDRNAMLAPDGKPVALVDVDELMVGDPLMAPTLAWAALSIQGLPTAHADAWIHELPWGRGSSIRDRLRACSGYWLINLISKVGMESATGLAESGSAPVSRELLSSWIDGSSAPL